MKSKNLLHTSVLAALALLAFCTSLYAQTAAPAGTEVSLKIDVVAWGDTIKGLKITTAGKSTPVTAEGFEYSKAVSYSGSNVLELSIGATANAAPGAAPVAPTPPTDPNAKLSELDKRRIKDPSIVALALLPSNSKRVTVLLAPGPKGTYNAVVIDDDPTKLPLGKLRVHNLTSIPISIRCNNAKTGTELQLKQTTIASPVEGAVIYELAYKQDNQWQIQENNLVRLAGNEQAQLIILKSDSAYFTSADGSRGGFLQSIVLRRGPKDFADPAPNP
jgi:hypothetical protein